MNEHLKEAPWWAEPVRIYRAINLAKRVRCEATWQRVPEWLRIMTDLLVGGGNKRSTGEWAALKKAVFSLKRLGSLAGFLRAGRLMASDPQVAAAFESTNRLGGQKAAFVAIREIGRAAPRPKPAPAERRKKLVDKRAQHAKAKLKEAERKLKTAKRLVAKWATKVRYYEKRDAQLADAQGTGA